MSGPLNNVERSPHKDINDESVDNAGGVKWAQAAELKVLRVEI